MKYATKLIIDFTEEVNCYQCPYLALHGRRRCVLNHSGPHDCQANGVWTLERQRPATENQLRFIRTICRALSINYNGHNFEEASRFISENVEEFYRQHRRRSRS